METIIMNKQYYKGAELLSHKKRLILYNKSGEILVYKRKKGLYIPSVFITENTNFEEEIKEILKIDFNTYNIEELITIINCKFRYNDVNNKLVKKHLKQIRDYYTCLAEFDKSIENCLGTISIDEDALLPKVMDIDEAIVHLEQTPLSNSKVYALKILKQKIKDKKYEGRN